MSVSGWKATGLLLTLAACAGSGPQPVDPDLDLRRAENAAAQGRWDWARLYYGRDFAAHPERLSSLREEGLAWLSGYQQSLTRGAEVLERYLADRPDDPEARTRLVEALLVLGERSRAATWAADLDSSPRSELLRAEILLDGDPAMARSILDRLLAEAPATARAHALAARLADRAGEAATALARAEEAVRLDPLDGESFYLLGRLRRRQGERAKAVEALALHGLVARLRHDGTLAPLGPDEEIAALDELERRRPGTPPKALAKRRLAALFRAGRLAEAGDLLAALETDPGTTLADLRDFAVQAGDAGRRGESRRLFERILDAVPGDRGASASLALLDLEAGDLAAARRRLEEGLAAHPDFARYHALLARVARAQEDAVEARRRFERALELAPWETAWRTDLAALLTALGDLDGARRVREAAPEP